MSPDELAALAIAERGAVGQEADLAIRFPCPHCGKTHKARAEKAGHKSRCRTADMV
jgi:predicted RNA-binding Zn-ribbon protein involved in translation (DUF1610 family)